MARFETTRLGGFDTARCTADELAQAMVDDSLKARANPERLPDLVFSSNGQGIALAATDPTFAATMNKADVIHADGMPIVMFSRLTAGPLPERIATTDFFHDAARAAQVAGISFFFLGATEDESERAVARVKELYPALKIAGRRNGYFEESLDGEVCREIQASGADVLWLAMGKPKQEGWAVRNQHLLGGVGWVKTCGGLYAFLAGDASRAPGWMRKLGLEWLYRTAQEPRRLAGRYATTNLIAVRALLGRTDWRHTKQIDSAV